MIPTFFSVARNIYKRVGIPLFSKERSCTGKVRYKRYSDADKAAARVLKRTGEVVRAYRCDYCEKIHIGHEPTHLFKARNALRQEPRGTVVFL